MPILPSGRYGKRSKPVRYAKAPLTRFGSVLRGTMRPHELTGEAAAESLLQLNRPLQQDRERIEYLLKSGCHTRHP